MPVASPLGRSPLAPLTPVTPRRRPPASPCRRKSPYLTASCVPGPGGSRCGGAPGLDLGAAAAAGGGAVSGGWPGPSAERGPTETAAAEDFRQLVLAANSDGLDLLRRGKGPAAFEQLKFAEAVLAANPAMAVADGGLLALTCSNLGCYYRRAGLPRAALQYLHRAMKAEQALLAEQVGVDASSLSRGAEKTTSSRLAADVSSLVKTKLNVCAALSGIGCHQRAEDLAAEAAHLLAPRCAVGGCGEVEGPATEQRREDCALLAVACHNLGAEREHLRRFAEAAVAYAQGADVATRALGPGSQLARALTASSAEALAKASKHPELADRPLSHGAAAQMHRGSALPFGAPPPPSPPQRGERIQGRPHRGASGGKQGSPTADDDGALVFTSGTEVTALGSIAAHGNIGASASLANDDVRLDGGVGGNVYASGADDLASVAGSQPESRRMRITSTFNEDGRADRSSDWGEAIGRTRTQPVLPSLAPHPQSVQGAGFAEAYGDVVERRISSAGGHAVW